jgi:hypothetical protein
LDAKLSEKLTRLRSLDAAAEGFDE